jgi:hypothetical protein
MTVRAKAEFRFTAAPPIYPTLTQPRFSVIYHNLPNGGLTNAAYWHALTINWFPFAIILTL